MQSNDYDFIVIFNFLYVLNNCLSSNLQYNMSIMALSIKLLIRFISSVTQVINTKHSLAVQLLLNNGDCLILRLNLHFCLVVWLPICLSLTFLFVNCFAPMDSLSLLECVRGRMVGRLWRPQELQQSLLYTGQLTSPRAINHINKETQV